MLGFNDDLIAKTLDVLSNPPVPVLDETVFVERYLPMFVDTSGHVRISEWLDVCGSPMMSVDVIDKNKTVLFRVPPLLDADDAALEQLRTVPIHEVLAIAAKKFESMGALGEAHIQYWLVNRVGSQTLNIASAVAWNKIFTRYNKPLIPIPGALVDAKSDTASTASTIDFDFCEDA